MLPMSLRLRPLNSSLPLCLLAAGILFSASCPPLDVNASGSSTKSGGALSKDPAGVVLMTSANLDDSNHDYFPFNASLRSDNSGKGSGKGDGDMTGDVYDALIKPAKIGGSNEGKTWDMLKMFINSAWIPTKEMVTANGYPYSDLVSANKDGRSGQVTTGKKIQKRQSDDSDSDDLDSIPAVTGGGDTSSSGEIKPPPNSSGAGNAPSTPPNGSSPPTGTASNDRSPASASERAGAKGDATTRDSDPDVVAPGIMSNALVLFKGMSCGDGVVGKASYFKYDKVTEYDLYKAIVDAHYPKLDSSSGKAFAKAKGSKMSVDSLSSKDELLEYLSDSDGINGVADFLRLLPVATMNRSSDDMSSGKQNYLTAYYPGYEGIEIEEDVGDIISARMLVSPIAYPSSLMSLISASGGPKAVEEIVPSQIPLTDKNITLSYPITAGIPFIQVPIELVAGWNISRDAPFGSLPERIRNQFIEGLTADVRGSTSIDAAVKKGAMEVLTSTKHGAKLLDDLVSLALVLSHGTYPSVKTISYGGYSDFVTTMMEEGKDKDKNASPSAQDVADLIGKYIEVNYITALISIYSSGIHYNTSGYPYNGSNKEIPVIKGVDASNVGAQKSNAGSKSPAPSRNVPLMFCIGGSKKDSKTAGSSDKSKTEDAKSKNDSEDKVKATEGTEGEDKN